MDPEISPIKKRVVLVVEDEAAIRAIAVETLRDSGFEVIEVSNGAEALAVLSSNVDIDLLFTDVRMPGLMDGIALANTAKALRPKIRTVVTSGQTGYSEPVDRLVVGARFLPKPYALDLLASAILAELSSETGSNQDGAPQA